MTTLQSIKSAAQQVPTKTTTGDPPSPAPTALSFSQGDDKASETSQRSPNTVDFITRDIDRDSPAAPGLLKKSPKGTMSRKRSTAKGTNYYGEVFAVRDAGPAIPKNAAVWVELKTNVILDDEFEFAKSLSEMIAKRYARTEDTVCVSIDHSACIIMGGTFDGSYLLTITSLSMVSPTCNKRNAALIGDWINQNLGVPSPRGYIKFVDPEFANYATGGFTMLDLMEKEEVQRTGIAEKSGILREKSVKRSLSRARSKKERAHSPTTFSVPDKDDYLNELPQSATTGDNRPSTAAGRMRKRSMFNMFSKSQRQ